mgnify:CR=1 FL=1
MVSSFHRCMLEVSRTNTFFALNKSRTDIFFVSDRHLPYTIQRGDRCFQIFWNGSILTWNGLLFPSVYLRSVYDKYFYHNQQKTGANNFASLSIWRAIVSSIQNTKGVNGASKLFETGVFWREMSAQLCICVCKKCSGRILFSHWTKVGRIFTPEVTGICRTQYKGVTGA